jgi:hypothetical protein
MGVGKSVALATVVVAIIICLLIAAIYVVGSMGRSNDSTDDDDDGTITPIIEPKPHLEIVSTSSDRDLLGDVTITVKVTNTGDKIGSKTIHAEVTSGTQTYTNTLGITLAPAETETFKIKVDTPFGAELDYYDAWLS